ncbi:MAG TPA: hypothetical protein VKK79_22475 [Candidatus Lokiarchaeia archaeon]|nr:hypothetical protein [Candidatus Lokiarchaeia archaeon]
MAFLAYLADALPTGANAIFSAAEIHEAMLLIPETALGEVFLTIYKGKEVFGKKIPLQTIDEIMQTIAFDDAFSPAPMDLEAWRNFTSCPSASCTTG